MGDGSAGHLGGIPIWIQDDETPVGRACGTAMAFVGQLDAFAHPDLNFGDAGVGYVFR